MKYNIIYTSKFKKDLKCCKKRRLDMNLLFDVIQTLEFGNSLHPKYRPHKLTGNYEGCWECHIQSDWLLVWQQDDEDFILLLTDTGTHADLFG